MPDPTTLDLLWGAPARPRRGPRPALTLERIVAEAVALADEDGLAALSMQRLAERLGFAKMALYRYVPGKDQLTALMLEAAIGEPPDLTAAEPGPGEESWRAALRRWAKVIFERYTAHPWTVDLAVGARPVGPHEMAWLEAALGALAGTGLTGPERLDAVVLLNGHVRGIVQQATAAPSADAGLEIAQQYARALDDVAGRFPAITAAIGEEVGPDRAAPGGGALAFGIERILDGLAVLVAERR